MRNLSSLECRELSRCSTGVGAARFAEGSAGDESVGLGSGAVPAVFLTRDGIVRTDWDDDEGRPARSSSTLSANEESRACRRRKGAIVIIRSRLADVWASLNTKGLRRSPRLRSSPTLPAAHSTPPAVRVFVIAVICEPYLSGSSSKSSAGTIREAVKMLAAFRATAEPGLHWSTSLGLLPGHLPRCGSSPSALWPSCGLHPAM
jgi:hypothetical protein